MEYGSRRMRGSIIPANAAAVQSNRIPNPAPLNGFKKRNLPEAGFLRVSIKISWKRPRGQISEQYALPKRNADSIIRSAAAVTETAEISTPGWIFSAAPDNASDIPEALRIAGTSCILERSLESINAGGEAEKEVKRKRMKTDAAIESLIFLHPALLPPEPCPDTFKGLSF